MEEEQNIQFLFPDAEWKKFPPMLLDLRTPNL